MNYTSDDEKWARKYLETNAALYEEPPLIHYPLRGKPQNKKSLNDRFLENIKVPTGRLTNKEKVAFLMRKGVPVDPNIIYWVKQNIKLTPAQQWKLDDLFEKHLKPRGGTRRRRRIRQTRRTRR